MYLSLYCKGSKRVTQGFTVRGSWRPNRIAIYWPPLLWPSALYLSRSPGLLNWRPRGPALCWWWLSLLHLITNWSLKLTGGPEGPFGRVWLSLPHLVSDVSDSQLTDFLSSQSYIIVQRPLNRPLNPWNGMFDRHQAEITVMQFFRCISLWVYHGIFTLSHFISQIRPRDLFRLLTIGMCHFLPAHHFGMACWAGSKVKIQQ